MMTDLENFRATVGHRQPERVLYSGGGVASVMEKLRDHLGVDDVAGHYGIFQPVMVDPKRPADWPPNDYSKYWQNETLPPDTKINSWGVAMVPSGVFHHWGYVSPLRNATSLQEIEEYPLDDYRQYTTDHMAAAVEAAHAAGKVAATGVGHMYESAWQVRGLEQFMYDWVERPAWAACLLDRIWEQNMVKAEAGARAGVDILHCGDDVASQHGPMFSLPSWREVMLSRWRRVWQRAREIKPDIHIFYHSDGNIIRLVGDLVDAGVDVLNPLQPECLDVDAIHAEYGDRVTFWGCIGTQTTMPFGTPADVRARVKECIDKYGRDGGLIIGPTHVLEPDVPIANIDALWEACRDYGRLR